MPTHLEETLDEFAVGYEFKGPGPLCVALVVTEHARQLPLDPDELVTRGGGQVLGLSKSAVQPILKR